MSYTQTLESTINELVKMGAISASPYKENRKLPISEMGVKVNLAYELKYEPEFTRPYAGLNSVQHSLRKLTTAFVDHKSSIKAYDMVRTFYLLSVLEDYAQASGHSLQTFRTQLESAWNLRRIHTKEKWRGRVAPFLAGGLLLTVVLGGGFNMSPQVSHSQLVKINSADYDYHAARMKAEDDAVARANRRYAHLVTAESIDDVELVFQEASGGYNTTLVYAAAHCDDVSEVPEYAWRLRHYTEHELPYGKSDMIQAWLDQSSSCSI